MAGIHLTDIEDFLKQEVPLLDVRSPSEYANGHIPGATNVFLLDDGARHETGIAFAKNGLQGAVKQALELCSDHLPQMLDRMVGLAAGKPLRVYCWRGGLRSRSVAFLAESAGMKAYLLKGGYRAFRQYASFFFEKPWRFIVLGGMTGSGKTEVLRQFHARGEQVLDLEGLANHKGSVFGSIGQPAQPTTEHFMNLIWKQLSEFDPSKPVWVEDESHSLGSCFIPDALFARMLQAPVVEIRIPRHVRAERLSGEYGKANPGLLVQDVMKIQKRLGLQQANEICRLIEAGQTPEAATRLLHYYDKAYHICLSRRKPGSILSYECDKLPDAGELLAFSKTCLSGYQF